MDINNRYFLTHCFSLREKGVREKNLSNRRFFLKGKSTIFLSKNNVSPKKTYSHAFRA